MKLLAMKLAKAKAAAKRDERKAAAASPQQSPLRAPPSQRMDPGNDAGISASQVAVEMAVAADLSPDDRQAGGRRGSFLFDVDTEMTINDTAVL